VQIGGVNDGQGVILFGKRQQCSLRSGLRSGPASQRGK